MKKKRVICTALGCKKTAHYDDVMEAAPGVFITTKTCKKHLGQLAGSFQMKGKNPIHKKFIPYSVSKESD